MEKASKEAKEHTSWVDPDPSYDDALRGFVEGILGDEEFTAALEAFVAPLIEPGRVNSLTQVLLKLTSPGVPDIYQGCELWDHSLVDPDNRRPVDYGERRRRLREGGHEKLDLTRAALCLPVGGTYAPVRARGEAAAHVLAFLRGTGHVTVVPRFPLGLAARGGFGATVLDLPGGRWTNVLTGATLPGGEIPVTEVMGTGRVALLKADGDDW